MIVKKQEYNPIDNDEYLLSIKQKRVKTVQNIMKKRKTSINQLIISNLQF